MWQKFVEAVGRHFRFLETEFGFAHKTTNPPSVIYESDNLRLLILFDVNRGHELDLGIRRLSDDPRKPLSLGIDTLMRFMDGPNTPGYPSTFPKTVDAVEAEVKRLAEHLRKYGSAILAGNFGDFDRLEREEKDIARRFGQKQKGGS